MSYLSCRDKACDIVITRREVSRHHAQLAVDDAGAVWLSSLGREPVSVNGKPATEAVELFTGDQIEVSISSGGGLAGMQPFKWPILHNRCVLTCKQLVD